MVTRMPWILFGRNSVMPSTAVQESSVPKTSWTQHRLCQMETVSAAAMDQASHLWHTTHAQQPDLPEKRIVLANKKSGQLAKGSSISSTDDVSSHSDSSPLNSVPTSPQHQLAVAARRGSLELRRTFEAKPGLWTECFCANVSSAETAVQSPTQEGKVKAGCLRNGGEVATWGGGTAK